MPRPAYIYTMILEYLEANKGLHSTEDIVKATNASYGAVARACRRLAIERRVKRRAGSGHSYLYEFATYEVPEDKKKASTVIRAVRPSVDPIDYKSLQGTLEKWVKEGWSPKSIEAANILVQTLSQLCQFQWLEITKGLSVDQGDLDHCKSKVQTARDSAANFLLFFDRLLATDELWDSKKITGYTLKDVADPQEFLERVREVSGALR